MLNRNFKLTMPSKFSLAPSYLAAILLAAMPAATLAENADRSKPINLEADTVTVDDLAKVSTYQGHVRLSQGTLLILADTLVVKK